MDKRRAIRIMSKSARMYRENLEDQKILFLYGVPSEIKKEILKNDNNLFSIRGYEVAFHRYNFLHLTGIKINDSKVSSSIHFYEKCLSNRLTEDDFYFASDGSTVQKLDILESMMMIKKNVAMIGEFTGRGPKLFTEKIAGNIYGCIGFVRDRNTGLNVPNTLLKKDIRDAIKSPKQKVYAVISKGYMEEKYTVIEKQDKSINIKECHFIEEIDRLFAWENGK